VHLCHASENASPKQGYFLPRAKFRVADMPTVMRKAFDFCRIDKDSAS
jgi:hypothetical protein